MSSDAERIPFTDLAPASSTRGVSIAERFDPYWSGLWPTSDGGANVSWMSHRSESILVQEGLVRPHKSVPRYDAATAIATLPNRRKWLHVLSAINLWQTVNSQQLAAITGYPTLANKRSLSIDALWIADLIQRGGFRAWGRTVSSTPELYRLDSKAHKADLSNLNYQDWLGVTSGTLSSRGHQYDRHNILMTEVSLRVGELCPTIAAVLGEALADWKRLFDPSTNPSQSRSADAVWLREDGLRIVVETAINYHANVVTKIKQLVSLLQQDKSDSVVVLFLTAAHPGRTVNFDQRAPLRKTIAGVVSSLHGSVRSKVASHLAVADWQDWFPALGVVSPAFFPLTAQSPTGPSSDRWQPVDLADPLSLPVAPSDPANAINVQETLANVAFLYGVPHWMRQEPDPTPLEHFLLAQVGFPDNLLFDPTTGLPKHKPPPVSPRPHRETWDQLNRTKQRISRTSSARRAAVSSTSKPSSAGGQQ